MRVEQGRKQLRVEDDPNALNEIDCSKVLSIYLMVLQEFYDY